jgi:GT2 family glycosyltransferase
MKTLLGCCTKHDRENFEKTPTYETMLNGFLHGNGKDHDFYESMDLDAVIKTNNKDNIGKHYNKVLNMAVDEEYDWVILMHDDVSMEDKYLETKLKKAFVNYDIVGLAGAKHIELKQPALWHLMSKQEDWSGAVAHPTGNHQVFMTSFGHTPERCIVLDGLFLAIKVSSLTPEIRFDENLPAIAHHYDLDFCLNANKHKLKLATWPIWVIHKSSGLENPGKEFDISQKYFLDKWKKEN